MNGWRGPASWGVVAGLVVVLAGCGFQPRGRIAVPAGLDRMEVRGAPAFTVLGAELRRRLRAHGIRVVEAGEPADAVLRILSNRAGLRVVSVAPTGKAQEYLLFTDMRYDVVDRQGRALLEPSNLRLTRTLLFDPNQVLAVDAEAAVRREDMEREAVRLILYRLQSLPALPADGDERGGAGR